jgi:phosphotriesterase-related protein
VILPQNTLREDEMAHVQTVAGPVALDDLGATLMHEHLVIAFEGWQSDITAPPRTREDLLAVCVERIEELKGEGYSSLVDPCPNDLGRDPELYAEAAQRTGFNILFATGLYWEEWAAPYWRGKVQRDPAEVENVAALYVRELTEGVGPSRLRPAVIKLAVGPDPASVFENRLIEAAAIASNQTGAPILTHTEAVEGDVLLGKLTAFGVPAHRIIIGHSCGSPDKAYHRRIVDGGAYIGFDRFGLAMCQSDEVRIDCLHALLQAGFAEQLIVSHDCAFCQRGQMMDDEIFSGRAPTHFTRNIAPKLRELGVGQAVIDGLLRDNPRRYFCDTPPVRQAAAKVEAEPA